MPCARKRVPVVPKKVKHAIKVLLEQPIYDLRAAAEAAGINAYQLREQMKKPHVRRWMRAERSAPLKPFESPKPSTKVPLKKLWLAYHVLKELGIEV